MPCEGCGSYEPTVAALPDGSLIVTTARADRLVLVRPDGTQQRVALPPFPSASPADARGDNLVATAFGRLYYSTLAVDTDGGGRTVVGIQTASTPDSGRTWTTAFLEVPSLEPLAGDRQWLGFGQEGAVHVSYSQANVGIWVASSTDFGATFTASTLAVPAAERIGNGQAGPITVAADGTLWLPYIDHGALGTAQSAIALRKSTDAGATWTRVSVAPGSACSATANWLPVASATTEGLYVAWVTGATALADPGRHVCVTRTADGTTWEEPQALGDAVAPGPWLEPGPGFVDLLWFQEPATGPAGKLVRIGPAWPPPPAIDVAPGLARDHGETDFPHMARTSDGRTVLVWSAGLVKVAMEE